MKKIKIGSDFSGVGAFNQSLIRLGIDYEEIFACDMDKYVRRTFILNNGTKNDLKLLKTPEVKKIDDVYYRTYIDKKLKPPTKEDIDFVEKNQERVARLFSFYYPWNVYERHILKQSLDLYVTSPPCQAFSLAGKRLGKDDKRGILFFNSHEFIKVNKPRYFIFENVKGLLSDDNGKTFSEWVNYLGGKSVNGNTVLFPHEESVPYHIYFKVLNAKDYNIPQNRERVFIVGIRDDANNFFNWPKTLPLTKRLKDVLEHVVDEKYFLSDKMLFYFKKHLELHKEKGNGFGFKPQKIDSLCANTLTSKYGTRPSDTYLKIEVKKHHTELNQIGSLYKNNSDAGRIYDANGISCTIKSDGGGLGAKTGLYEVHNRIRRLTPKECFSLMDFNEDFIEKTINSKLISDTQLYKQSGNSICVGLLAAIISNLKLD